MSGDRREPVWRRYLRLLRANVDADVTDELRFHLEMRERELAAKGMSPELARRAVRERFGDVERVASWLRKHDRRRQRAAERSETMRDLAQHVRSASRGLRRQPAFTAAAVLTLAVGIGASTAIFGVVNGVLLEPLPYAESARLVELWHASPILEGTLLAQSFASYDTYRRQNRVLTDIGLYQETAVNLSDGSAPPNRVPSAHVTAGFFPVLRVRPLLGRLISADDDRPGRNAVVVIGEGFWRRRLQGSSGVVGQRLRIDGRVHEIIGVVPEQTRFPREDTQLWLPLAFDPATGSVASFDYKAIGRLRPGVTIAAAAADLQRVLPAVPQLYPAVGPHMSMADFLVKVAPRVVVHPLRNDVVGDVGPVLWVIFGVIGFVLLAACANIGNLYLVRAEGRRGELAIRAALGAGRSDALARLFAEALLVASVGAALGIGIAAAGLRILREVSSIPIPRLAEVGVNGTVVAAAIAVTLAVALVTSALPMLRISSRDLAPLLRSGGRGSTGGRDRRGMQRALVVAQVALAFVLLASCALMARTFVELRRVRLGFDPEHTLSLGIALTSAEFLRSGSITRFHAELGERLMRLPGVVAVGATSWMPLTPEVGRASPVWVEGDESPRSQFPPARRFVVASPGYFRALTIPLVAGRLFRELRDSPTTQEVIVSAAFAAQAMGDSTGRRAVGRRVRMFAEAPWITVVGVVGSVHDVSLDREPSPVVYLPFQSNAFDADERLEPDVATVVVRTAGDPVALVAAVRREVAALDPSLPIFDVRPVRELVRGSMARTAFTALMLTIAAGVALALGAIGLSGVVAYTVSQRRREIGLRIALGAQPDGVSRMFARQGAELAALGVAVGVVGALFVTRALGAMLYGVSPTNPLVLGAAAGLLLVVALAASWLPARRASRVDPVEVLGSD